MSEDIEQTPGLDDDQLLDLADDPKAIESREIAAEVIDCLDHKIAGIQAQLDLALIEAAGQPLSVDRQDWVRRASYAKSMAINSRHRVIARDKTLARDKGKHVPDPAKAETQKLKQERLMLEAEARREAKGAKAEQLRTEQMRMSEGRREREAEQRYERRFVAAARTILPPDIFNEIRSRANAGMEPDRRAE